MEKLSEVTEAFETNRPHLRAVAYRMLGSRSEADDAVQEAWFRLNRNDSDGVANLTGWLTTVVARICLDMLRARKVRLEGPLRPGAKSIEPDQPGDPERDVLLADSVGLALLVVLETLAPAERVAFVLHDLFAVPFEEIAPIVGRSSDAARQLASRARRRVQQGPSEVVAADDGRQRKLVEAFLVASRDGNFEALLRVLDEDVVLRADETALRMGAAAMGLAAEVRGAAAVADLFKGRSQGARLALVNGLAGALWAPGGQLRVVTCFTIAGGRIAALDLIADPVHLASFALEVLER